MSMIPPSGPVVRVKPQPDIYTVMLILGILFMIAAIFMGLQTLMSAYGLSFGALFSPQSVPVS